MDCDALRERLSPLLDDRLDAADRPGVEAHLAGCRACAAELDALRAGNDLLARLPLPSLDDALVQRTISRARRPRALPRLFAAAAAALLFALALAAVSRPSLTRATALERLAVHAAALEPFARQVANLEGRDPALDLALIRFETDALELGPRTKELAHIVTLVPEAREYVELSRKLVVAVETAEPARMLHVRDAARRWSLHEHARDLRVRLSLRPARPAIRMSYWTAVPEQVRPFARGHLTYISGDYAQAGTWFTSYVTAFPDGAFRDSAMVWLAEANALSGRVDYATVLPLFSAIANGTTWSTDVQVVAGFQNACVTWGTATIDGKSLVDFSTGSLSTAVQTSVLKIEPADGQVFYYVKSDHALRFEPFQEYLDVDRVPGAVQFRADRTKVPAEVIEKLDRK